MVVYRMFAMLHTATLCAYVCLLCNPRACYASMCMWMLSIVHLCYMSRRALLCSAEKAFAASKKFDLNTNSALQVAVISRSQVGREQLQET